MVIRSSDKTLCGLCWVRVECGRYFPATWCFALFCFSCTSAWGQSTEKTVGASGVPSMQDVEKALPTTRLLAGRSQPSVLRPLGQFQKMRAQLLRLSLVPRVDDVRKCLLSCSGQEQANKSTRRPTFDVCLWPKLRILVSQICVVVP